MIPYMHLLSWPICGGGPVACDNDGVTYRILQSHYILCKKVQKRRSRCLQGNLKTLCQSTECSVKQTGPFRNYYLARAQQQFTGVAWATLTKYTVMAHHSSARVQTLVCRNRATMFEVSKDTVFRSTKSVILLNSQ